MARLSLAARRIRLTVAGETPVCWAICWPVKRWRRSAMIRSTVSGGVGSRNRLGRDERSARPAGPSATNLATHLFTVLISTPKALATAVGDWPSPSTRRTNSARLTGVVRAFLCRFIRSPENH